MMEPTPNNNEFQAAEDALRNVGSNLWFGELSGEWQDFLISNTLEQFDTYEVSMPQAAANLISIYQELVTNNPEIVNQNPWKVII